MFELFIAKRYLRAKRKQVMISVITVISVIGVATGVMALVIAIAIANGSRNTMQRAILAATAHVIVQEKGGGSGISDWREISGKLKGLPGVLDVTPALYAFGFMDDGNLSAGVHVKGISTEPGRYRPDILTHLKTGSFGSLNEKDGRIGVILGSDLAKQLGASAGEIITLVNPSGNVTPFGPKPLSLRVRVAGTFESGLYDLDSSQVFMDLRGVQHYWGYPDVVNAIELNLKDADAAPEVAKAAETVLAGIKGEPELAVTTWEEQSRLLLDTFKMLRLVIAITIGLIQIVAALNILITLVMMVMEKHRDIAVLMSMGARAPQIRRIFVLKGALIGSAGTVIGLVLGYGFSFLANHYQWVKLDTQMFEFRYVPFESNWTDAIWISALAMTVSLLATVYPAQSATRVAPAETMRYE